MNARQATPVTRRGTLFGTLLALCLAGPVLAGAAEEPVAGVDTGLGVAYQAVAEESGDAVRVEVRLDDKRVVARVDYDKQTLSLHSLSLVDGTAVPIDEGDLAALRALGATLSPDGSRAGEALASTIEFAAEYAPDEIISLETEPRLDADPWTPVCVRIGLTQPGRYTVGAEEFVRRGVLGACGPGPGDCLGRCGPGCGPPPGEAVQRFTQECFNYDLCVAATGGENGPCSDERSKAAPGFFFARDCANLTGAWNDSRLLSWRLDEVDGKISGRVDTGPECGTWSVAGSRDSFSVKLTATNPGPVEPGCCADLTYTGTIQCNAGSGAWTDTCGDGGSWNAQRELPRHLVASYPFEGDATDFSGDENHGTVVGGVSFVEGLYDLGASFDGVTGYVGVPDSPSLQLTNFTLSAWVNPNSFDGNYSRILEKGESNSYWLYFMPSGAVTTGFYRSGYHDLLSTKLVTAGRWTFVVATYDGQKLRIYIDGKPSGSRSASGAPAQTSDPLVIGWKFNGVALDHFDGLMDDVRILDRAATFPEIQEMMRSRTADTVRQ